MRDNDFSISLSQQKETSYNPLINAFNQTSANLRHERQRLYQREMMLDKVLNASPMVTILVDHRDTIVFTNNSAQQAFELNGSQADVAAFMNKLQIFAIAEGLGGVESLVGHPRTMSHSRVPEDQKAELGLTEKLVRLSVGIEHIDDLIADIDQALG